MPRRRNKRPRPAARQSPIVVDDSDDGDDEYADLSPRTRVRAIAQDSKGRPCSETVGSKRWRDACAALKVSIDEEWARWSEKNDRSSLLDGPDDLEEVGSPPDDLEQETSSSDGSVPRLMSEDDRDSFEVSTEPSSDDDGGGDVDLDSVNRKPMYGHGVLDMGARLEPSSVAGLGELPRRVRDRTVPDIGMEPAEMARFMLFSPPKVLLAILALMHCLPEFAIDFLLDTVEFFAGEAQVTKNWAASGLRSLAYDVKEDKKYQNLNGDWGFIAALQALRRLRPGRGCTWMGTVCSTWVFMSRASTMRTELNPQGDVSRRCVVRGNRQASRSSLVMAYCYSRLCGFVLEQPASSLLWHHPSLRHVQRVAVNVLRSRYHRVSLYMYHYNAKHMKKT